MRDTNTPEAHTQTERPGLNTALASWQQARDALNTMQGAAPHAHYTC